MFFSNWQPLGRIAVVGVCAYVALILLLRVSGKRTLSKLNAFDLVVTVALGSTLATVLVSKDVTLAEGLAAFGLLIGMQYVVAWLSIKSSSFSRIVKSEPRLLFYRGQFLRAAMDSERVTEDEIREAIRLEGIATLEAVEAVVLETAGTISVMKQPEAGSPTALQDVRMPDELRQQEPDR